MNLYQLIHQNFDFNIDLILFIMVEHTIEENQYHDLFTKVFDQIFLSCDLVYHYTT
jgi:hypothetical protein